MREAIPAASSAIPSANSGQGAASAHGISLGEATRVWTRIAQLLPWHEDGFSLDVPVLTSIDPFATILAIAAAIALFRFKIGAIPTLLGCSLAGIALVLAVSGVR